MTYQQIYRTMNGIFGMRHVRSATTENIRRSVEKMSCAKICLENTDEENLVSVIPCDEVYHGHNIAGITLLQCPVLCRYAETAGRMKEVPGDLWSIKSGSGKQMCTLERSIAFRDTLTECVITKKCRNGKNFRIGLKEITENAGIPFENLERKRRQRDRELIRAILDHFVRTGYLKSFTINIEEKNGAISGLTRTRTACFLPFRSEVTVTLHSEVTVTPNEVTVTPIFAKTLMP